MNVCIFEDGKYRDFQPLVYLRPTYELRLGMNLLWQRIARNYPGAKQYQICREHLKATQVQAHSEVEVNGKIEAPALFINGRLVMKEAVPAEGADELGLKGDELVYARLSDQAMVDAVAKDLADQPEGKDAYKSLAGKVESKEVEAELAGFLWDLYLDHNGPAIVDDFKQADKSTPSKLPEGVSLLGDKSLLHVGEGCEIMPSVVLDTREGPIYISNKVKIYPHVYFQGPVFIGEKTQLFAGQIWENTSLGEDCRIGGEVEGCIFQSHSNKRHNGALCHCFVGQWINLGGGFVNSDLKNTYGEIKVKLPRGVTKTGSNKVGGFIADHAKTGINSTLYTGKTVGVASQILGAAFDDIPAFTFWAKSLELAPTEMFLESVLEIGKRVMERRDVEQTEADRELLKKVFEMTAADRDAAKVKRGKIEK